MIFTYGFGPTPAESRRKTALDSAKRRQNQGSGLCRSLSPRRLPAEEFNRHCLEFVVTQKRKSRVLAARLTHGFHYGGDDRDRTDGLSLAKAALSQLSYIPTALPL
jgi:hypothetical protein